MCIDFIFSGWVHPFLSDTSEENKNQQMFDVNLAIRECKQTNLLKNLLILIFNNFIEDDRNRTLSLVFLYWDEFGVS